MTPHDMSKAALLMSLVALCACDSMDMRPAIMDLARGACKSAENCYATCADGTRTDPQRPFCDAPTDPDHRRP